MGNINVVRDDGSVVSVDEDLYNKAQGTAGHQETLNEAESRHQAAANKNAVSGVLPTIAAGLSGAVDTAMFGIPGMIGNAVSGNDATGLPKEWGPEFAKQPGGWQNMMRQHSVASAIGNAAGLLSPVGVGGVATRAGEKVTAAVGSKFVGRLAEGAIVGIDGHIVHTNVTGDPLSVEGAVTDAGIGALLTAAFGAVGDQLVGAAGKAKAGQEAAAAKATRVKAAQADFEAFKSNPIYDEALAANKSAVKANNTAAGEAKRATDKYDAFVGSNAKFKAAVSKAEGVVNTVERRPGYMPETAPAPAAAPEATPFDLSDVEAPPTEAAPTGKISDELKEYRGRISDIYKKRDGGWRLSGPRKWVKDASVEADPTGAMEDLRGLQDDLMKRFPKASGKLADLPPVPSSTPPTSSASVLPKSLREFAEKRTDAVRKLAIEMDETTLDKFGELANDLGVQPAENKIDTVLALHNRVSSSLDFMDELAAAQLSEAKEASSGLLGWVKARLKSATGLGVGRLASTAVGGGFLGAFAHIGVGDAAKAAMGYTEDALLGNAMVSSKEGIRGKIRDLVADYGGGAGRGVQRLGPVTSILGTSFPSGSKDPEPDQRQQAVNRITDVIHANIQAPDAMFNALRDMMGHPADLAFKIHSQVTGALKYLLAVAPKDPGLDMKMGKSSWTASHQDTIALAHAMEGVLRPTDAIQRALQGDGHEAATEALWNAHPALMQEFAMEIANNMPKKTTYEEAGEYSMLLRQPMSPLQEPIVALALQSLYLPTPGQQQGGGGSTGGAPGRPPAYNSQVAGSSVSGLIS